MTARSWVRDCTKDALLHAVVRVTVIVIVALFNPFEVSQWSNQRSEMMWQRLHADRYDPTAAPRDPLATLPLPVRNGKPLTIVRPDGTAHGRDATTIVYFDEASVKSNGDTRPLSAYVLADLIEDIRLAPGNAGAPRGIFVDMLLTYAAAAGQTTEAILSSLGDENDAKSCGSRSAAASPFRCLVRSVATATHYAAWKDKPECRESTVAKLSCIRDNGGTPILFANPLADNAGTAPAMAALETVSATVPVTVDETSYPLADPAMQADRAGRSFRLYPAAALYALWCASPDGRCHEAPPVVRDRFGRDAWSDLYDRPVSVTWGVGGRSWFTDFLDAHRGGELQQYCAPANPSIVGTATSLAAMLASGLHFNHRARCPYTNAVPYSLLQGSVMRDEMAALFADRLVMIGAAFVDSNDVVKAAPFTNVPGVYYHAMALDNLIENGADYPKSPEPITSALDISWSDPISWIEIFAVVFVIAAALEAMRRLPSMAYKRANAHREATVHAQAAPEPAAITVVATAPHAMRTRLMVSAAVTLILFVLIFGVTHDVALVPRTADFVVLTLVCILGIGELFWEAVDPMRGWFAHHCSPARWWRAVASPAPAPAEPTKAD